MIKVNNVSKKIKRRTILEDITLQFEQGKMYLLRGHNGSGKTMLLRLLCGLIKPDTGTVEQKDYTYGVLIENPQFEQHETARENLNFLASIQKKIGKDEIETSLAKVNLLKHADEKVKTFSLGMKQRLGLSQAIMENPDVLLLDEPFNALDDKHFELIIELLQEWKKDKIIVIAAHGFDYEKYPIFDEVILMNDGKISEKLIV